MNSHYPHINDFSAENEALLQRTLENIRKTVFNADLDPQTEDLVETVLSRVVTTIGQIGYDDFHDTASLPGAHGSPKSIVGAGMPINMVPSDVLGACHPVLLAIAKGKNKRSLKSFPMVMRQVRKHLIQCELTQTVLLLTDTWDPSLFEESAEDL